jgi:hypothetical protein
MEADPDASGRVGLPAFLTAAPSIFAGLTDFTRPDLVSTLSPPEVAGWSSQVNLSSTISTIFKYMSLSRYT